MAHTGPRTTCTPLRYHIGVMNTLWTLEGGIWVFHPERVTPQISQALGDFIGGLNSADAAQYPGQGWPVDPDSGPPFPWPPVQPVDPIASFIARQAVSQNCAWFLVTPQESGALLARGVNTNLYQQFYTVGGSGGLGINERLADAATPSPSGYIYVDANQQWRPDPASNNPAIYNQGSDALVAQLAADQHRDVPPPVQIPPP